MFKSNDQNFKIEEEIFKSPIQKLGTSLAKQLLVLSILKLKIENKLCLGKKGKIQFITYLLFFG